MSEPREISIIAREIRSHWPKVNYAAEPYLSAMASLGSISDHFGCDTADMIIRYFLGNARAWRGAEAKRIKAELKAMIA